MNTTNTRELEKEFEDKCGIAIFKIMGEEKTAGQFRETKAIIKDFITSTIKQAVDDSLNDVWEKVEGLKKDRPHEIPFDSYHERMAGVIGNNQALDQVLSILKEKE